MPGENPENETGMAAKKNINSVKGSELILEALDVYRTELVEQQEDPNVRHFLDLFFNSIAFLAQISSFGLRLRQCELELLCSRCHQQSQSGTFGAQFVIDTV